MKRERSFFAGMTDYTGVSLDAIIEHIEDWNKATKDELENLENYARLIENNESCFNDVEGIKDYIFFFTDLFKRYISDLDKLVLEMKGGVADQHIEIIRQLCESSQHEEHSCVNFKKRYIACALKDEKMRTILDSIYARTRGLLIDYRDMSNIIHRLKVFTSSDIYASATLPIL